MRGTRSKEASFCEIDDRKTGKEKTNRTALYRHKGNFQWQGIKDVPYKTEGDEWSGIIRRVLIGSHGESTRFHVRYFEISHLGCSSLERHRHEHVVICVKGRGMVRTGKVRREVGFMDTVYISPDTPHQLENPYDEPFGFICIVNAKRDKPRVLKQAK
ncbi:MAG: cupin domain-containing protein [Nitrospirae bacterium]|nr:cupin domain-containing protein [Nitrospirota bacterium]